MAKSFRSIELENKISSRDMFLELLNDCTDEKGCQVVSFINPFSYKIISQDDRLIKGVDYWFVDGELLCKLTNFTRKQKIERASFDMSSVAVDFLNDSSENNIPIALIGAKSEEIDTAIVNLKRLYPGLDISYSHHGYLQKCDFKRVCEEISHSQAKRVVVGMGTPMQEEFALAVKQYCSDVQLVATCGGFLTQTSIKADYYLPIVKKLGLRWLQRAIMHSHVRKRLFKDYPIFVIRYLLNK